MVPISPSICMHGHHGVCVLKKVSTSNNMHEVNRNRAAVHKSEPGSQESLNTLVSTPGRGFTGICTQYAYMYFCFETYACIYPISVSRTEYIYIPVNPLPGVETNGLSDSRVPGLLF